MAVYRNPENTIKAGRGVEPVIDISALPEAPAWHAGAICRQTDPESFFPDKGGSTKAAKRTCAGCPVRRPCLQWALDHEERFGVWGGLSERERRRILRERKAS